MPSAAWHRRVRFRRRRRQVGQSQRSAGVSFDAGRRGGDRESVFDVMTQAIAAALGVFLLLAGGPSAQRRTLRADLVELDVVVLDGGDRPIRDLRQEDFEVKEDGQRVDVKTFAAIVATGTTRADDGRSVVLLMDDS